MPEAVHGMFIAEHFLLQGATVIDGPEYVGYSTIYNGQLTPCYKNTTADIFRKVLDGTIKIPTVSEVRSNSPLVYVTDSPNWWDSGITPADFYDGLYMMAGNQSWLKSSGRYGSIPETFTNGAYELSFFQTNVLQTLYSNRWATIAAKTNEFNILFPVEYSSTNGPFFASRRGNRWLTYNPYINSNLATSASLSLKYNTCTNLFLQYPPQTFAVITESNQSLQIYFNNYFTDKDALWVSNNVNVGAFLNSFLNNPTDSTTNTTRTTIIQISGCTNTPTYLLTDRGGHKPMTNSATFASGIFTLTLTGNGPCDITINCAGSAARTNIIPANNVMVPPPNFVPGVPAPPGLVCATPGYKQANLTWHATNGLFYNLKRGTSVNGPFTNIATGITNSVNLYSSFISGATVYNTSYSIADATVTVSNTYYYVVSVVNVSGEGSNSAPAVVTIIPIYTNTTVADAYVESSTANSNYGTSTNLLVKNNVTSGSAFRNAYLMYDVHAMTNVRSATVTLMPNRVDDSTVPIYYELASTNWTETGITWNNQPGGVGIFMLTNTVAVGVPVVFDVTSAAASQATNGGLLSLRITQPTNSLNGLVQFCSKENPTANWRPTLTYTPSVGLSPTGLVANPVSANQITLSWSGTSAANYYNIRRSTRSGGPYTLLAQGVLTTYYSDTSTVSGTHYYYVVSAVASGGESADSPPANTLTPLLPAPAGLTATLGGNQVALSWAVLSGAGSYNVKRAFTSGGPYTTIATGLVGTNINDAVFFTGASYYYVVSGVDAGGEGAYTAEASVTTSNNMTMEPTDDAYVEDGSSSNSNFGTSATLKVKNQGPGTTFTRITYIKFDVHTLANAQSMKLMLTPYEVDGTAVTNAFELVTNDGWNEATIVWTNQPGGSGVTFTNLSGSTYSVGTQVTADVTGAVLNQATNDGYLSLRIMDPNTNAILIGYASKEYPATSYHPVLQFVNPGNTAPTLLAISNRTIGAGVTLNITNSATDADVPAQTLTFTLPRAPTNAGLTLLNASSAVFSWRPSISQAATTNAIKLKVTDNGTPNLSATQSFYVFVTPVSKPSLAQEQFTNVGFRFNVNGDAGPDYIVQASTNLADWSSLFTTNSPSLPFSWMDAVITNYPKRFYRVLLGP